MHDSRGCTGPCIGHVGPEALAGGPIAKVRDGDIIEIEIDRQSLAGRVDLVDTAAGLADGESIAALLESRDAHPDLAVEAELPDDTRLWAALQQVGGGTWGGCVYDVDEIAATLEAGIKARQRRSVSP